MSISNRDKNTSPLAAAVLALREAQSGKRLSQRALGEKIGGVTTQTVFRYERGETPETNVLWHLARVASANEATTHLTVVFMRPISDSLRMPLAAVALAVVASSELHSKFPDAATLRRIARRAAELLGEE